MADIRYQALVEELAGQIRSGRLPPGTRLPTHRQLAQRHGVALVTASRAYAELRALGLVSGEIGRGTFVRESAVPDGLGRDQQAVAAGLVDLNFNYPSLPGQAELLRGALRQLAAGGELESLLRYAPHGGRPHERAGVARHLAARGVVADASRVLVVDGAQHGLAVAVMALLQPGDAVAIDALSYPGFKVLAEMRQLQLVPLPAANDGKGQGPDPDALERQCRRRRIRALYTMPTLHNPLGWVMGDTHRRRLVAIARRHGLCVIEDAAYAYLAQDAPPPLAALAPELTVHVSGLSKSVATGLRIGYMAAPEPWVPKLERAIRATTWSTPGLTTAIACQWLADGTVDRLEAEKRQDARTRQTIASQVLGELHCVRHPNSYFTWLPLPEETRADALAAALMREGVSVSTAEPFAMTRHVPHAIRLALGSVPLDSLRAALLTVRRVLEQQSY